MAHSLDDLQRILKASEGKYGTAARVAAIKARIVELEALEQALPPSIGKGR